MSQPPPEAPPPDATGAKILGLSTSELAGLSVDELTGNKTAITMLMHYYTVLVGENGSLKNDLNTARTYVAGYDRKRTNTTVGAGLLLLSNVLIGFGINLLTTASDQKAPGWILLGSGVITAALGTWFSVKER